MWTMHEEERRLTNKKNAHYSMVAVPPIANKYVFILHSGHKYFECMLDA